MSKVISTKKAMIGFGKIRYGAKIKCCPTEVEIELRRYESNDKSFQYDVLAITGNISTKDGRMIAGGQCLDEMLPELKKNELFMEIYCLWKTYHLNDMHAGTPVQEAVLKEAGITGKNYDYDKAVECLKEKDLYEVPFTGKTIGRAYHDEPYRYGCGWVINDLPEHVRDRVIQIIDENNRA